MSPTLAEIDAFLADTSPQAFERVVDRYLASAAYRERMTMDRLDLTRYADTYGYQADVDRDMSPCHARLRRVVQNARQVKLVITGFPVVTALLLRFLS